MSQELYSFTHGEVAQLLSANDEGSLSQASLTPSLEEWVNQEVVTYLQSPLKNWQPEWEEVIQTGTSVETNPFPGDCNFRVHIQDSDSKHYAFSEKYNRLYCHIDKAIPIIFKWEGLNISHIRAMLVFKDPDNLSKPVFRCRSHSDETVGNNLGIKYIKHIVRCDNENVFYKENTQSRRLSVIRQISPQQSGSDGVEGFYRFMCNTTCNGVDAIARRRTDLVLFGEGSNGQVLGRAVFGLKICTCPHRDKRRDEEDGDKRKRKSNNDLDCKKFVKKELSSDVVVPPSPVNILVDKVTTSDTSQSHIVKREVKGEGAGDYIDLQVSIPNFPKDKVGELQNSLNRLVASFYIPDDVMSATTEGVQIYRA